MTYNNHHHRNHDDDGVPGIVVLVLALVFLGLIPVLVFLAHLDSNDTEIKINTDKISACTKSDDVVGCLETLKPTE